MPTKARGYYACGHEIKKNVSATEKAEFAARPCQACKKAGWKPETAGKPLIEVLAPEQFKTDQDVNPVAVPSALTEAAQSIQAGTPVDKNTLGALADQTTQLQPQTWTPGAYCRQRSRNRKTGTLIGLYSLEHTSNNIVVPPTPADGKPIRWAAQCENHGARYFHNSVNDAWSMRNQPWLFCPGCQAIMSGQAASLTTKTPTVTVEAKKKAQPKVKVKAAKQPKSSGGTKTAAPAEAPKNKRRSGAGKKGQDADAPIATGDGVIAELTPAELEDVTNPVADPEYVANMAVDLPEPTPPSEGPQDDPEAKTWADWSQKLASAAPAGTSVDWLGAYHYGVDLPEPYPTVELYVKADTAVFRTRLENGQDVYADTFAEMLDKLEVPTQAATA